MKTIPLLLLPLFTLIIAGCGTDTVKREPPAPPVSEKFALKGHLTPKDTIENTVQAPADIPDLAQDEGINLNPKEVKPKKLYSVSAINVPVSDLLFNLAKDAGKQLDLSVDVKGRVTVNVINQPLDVILQRIVEQVNAIYNVQYGTISIQPDQPYWKSYEIDYVNVVKNIKDETVMRMSVGNVGESSNSSGSAQQRKASEFNLESKATHDFGKV